MLHPVIIAGGSGSRLWPLSRQLNPKQFLALGGDGVTMLQATLNRLAGLNTASPVLICNEQHRFLAAEQLRQSGCDKASIILEPYGRNTAPAIALAALSLVETDPAACLLVLAADHVINDKMAFHSAIGNAGELAKLGRLVTFGIVPTHAETGYGYIERGQAIDGLGFAVQRFVEKPDLATASSYVESDHYLWNSGMFVFTAKRYLEELERFQPRMLKACKRALAEGVRDLDFIRISEQAFAECPDDSVDYAVMEHTSAAAVVPLIAGWSDVGSWSTLWDISDKDESGNVLYGDTLAEECHDSYIRSDSRLVAALGVKDLVIVETKDAVLVAHKNRAQDLKRVVRSLETDGRHEHLNHREVYRPWGVYDSIDQGNRYQVKRITVKPGAKLSLQKHHHRAEHWIVVSGAAQVTIGDKTTLVTENQSTYIPIGQVHCLENPGKIPLELIEVQSGSYLGEDDIVRLEDIYGRA
ncbi:mannose-1-phosphate guanylyltransferase/mannose-6-phosphate isomerase [Pseudomonas matsuisoli]|uniref:Alginate biosynthesis protein AlgA n=1 Tax=Pseudomonas matsuisoli TaxID=1515666 RepID=A0A917Q3D4_9PSED|nr:mannose-1-phosphate guanylyltransferase/mannose-6-phosphate isomerase [Pseudomonas matsuisoli]GGK10638.1 mannose-1-phosphate guanyltransferase [Pseudomonas matsuisoli]